MKNLSRLELFSRTINKFIRFTKLRVPQAYAKIDISLVTKYCDKENSGYSCFGVLTPDQRRKTLLSAANDLYFLVCQFKDVPEVNQLMIYQIMEKVLADQCDVVNAEDQTDTQGPIKLKEPKQVSGSSIQSPTDPDAGFSGHKGKGYHAQIMETCSDDPLELDEKGNEIKPLNLITYVQTESADKHDAHALVPAIEEVISEGLAPTEILADTAYGGDNNQQYAAEKGMELVAPVPGTKHKAKASDGTTDETPKKDEEFSLSDFPTDSDGNVTECPKGQKCWTNRNEKTGDYNSLFDYDTCLNCPFGSSCPVKVTSAGANLHYTAKDIRIANRRKYQKTEEWKRRYRLRSGIEASNSQLARSLGMKHLRVRGFKAVDAKIKMKALGLNIRRTVSHVSQNRAKCA
jgi:hypothetical protein